MSSRRQRFIVINVVAVGLIALCGSLVIWLTRQTSSPTNDNQGLVILRDEVKSISNECDMDGLCSVKLASGKSITTGCGLGPDNTTCASYNQRLLKPGDHIEATVVADTSSADTYTLECGQCTIRQITSN